MIPPFAGADLRVGLEVETRPAPLSSDSNYRSARAHADVPAFLMQLRPAARALITSPVRDSRDIGDIFAPAAEEAPSRCRSSLTVAHRTAAGPY